MSIKMNQVCEIGSGSKILLRNRKRGQKSRVSCSASSLTEQYKTLRVQPGASEKEVKKAFRRLALQYHPDVCKGNNCKVQFHRINEAYDSLMNRLRESERRSNEIYDYGDDESMVYEDLWEEWMGWEGAGIRDYSSHINPYI